MANMSYVRCENTASDLAEVVEVVEGGGRSAFRFMSDTERQAAARLYRLCQEYIDLYDNNGGDEEE